MKSVLVIDTPKTCTECACHLWQVCVPADEDIDEYINPSKGKPDWCPLRPMPEQMSWGHTADYIEGYNACLEEIMGERT